MFKSDISSSNLKVKITVSDDDVPTLSIQSDSEKSGGVEEVSEVQEITAQNDEAELIDDHKINPKKQKMSSD